MENRIGVSDISMLSSTLNSMIKDIEIFKNNIDQVQNNTISTLGTSWVGKDADELSKTINTINNNLKTKADAIINSTNIIQRYVSTVEEFNSSEQKIARNLYGWKWWIIMAQINERRINISDIYSYITQIEINKNELQASLKKYIQNIQYFIDKKALEGNIKKSLEELNSVIKKFLDYDVSADYEKIISFVRGSALAIEEIDRESSIAEIWWINF